MGSKRLYLSTVGTGPVTGLQVNGKAWHTFDRSSVFLAYSELPEDGHIVISLGGSHARHAQAVPTADRESSFALEPGTENSQPEFAALDARAEKVRAFQARLTSAGLGASYEPPTPG